MINKESLPQTFNWQSPILKRIAKLVRWQDALLLVVGILIARTVVGEGLRPFALPFFAAFGPQQPWLVLLALILGHVSTGAGGLLWLLLPMVPMYFIRIRAPTLPQSAVVTLAVSGQMLYRVPGLIHQTMLSYDFLLYGLDLALAATAAVIFYQAREALRQSPSGAEEGSEQILCLVVTCALALTSLSGVYLGPVAILPLLGAWVVLTAAMSGGAGIGAGVGLVAGILSGFGHLNPAVPVAAFALAGLLGGLFFRWGKPGVYAGFTLGLMAMLIYGGQAAGVLGIYDLGLAGLLLWLVPSGIISRLKRLLINGNNEWTWEYQQRLRGTTVQRLQRLAHVFARLSHSFAETGATADLNASQHHLSSLLEHVTAKVCTGCVNYRRCWESELYSSYRQLVDYLVSVEKNPDAEFDGLLARRCHNIEQLLIHAQSCYRQYCSERRWFSRVRECEGVVSEQLQGLSEVITQLSRQFRLDVTNRGDLEDELERRLASWGVEVREIEITGIEKRMPRITIRARVPPGENPVALIKAMSSDTVGQPLDFERQEGSGEEVLLVLAVPQRFTLEMGVAQAARGEVSGDCFTHLQAADGKQIYMLSDGMGMGQEARQESSQTLLLARDMLDAGFSAETAIKAINALLVLRQGQERFATLDMAVVDSHVGTMELYKTGAATSFLKNGEQVEVFSAASLPIGIIPGVEPQLVSRGLAQGDYLVMVSDGLFDEDSRDEFWVVNQLRCFGNVNAGTMAKQLLNRATRSGDQLQDDATVVVVRVKSARTASSWTDQRAG
jgi:stage II sporulation protein E